MISHNHLRVQTNLADLNQVLEWFEQYNQPSIPRKAWIQCKTALAEGFTNAVKHAHKGRSVDTSIDVEVKITSEKVEIRIFDSGEGFDLDQKLKSLTEEPDLDAFSGRGINMIRQLVDHFSYTRATDDRNCLLMVKHYSATY